MVELDILDKLQAAHSYVRLFLTNGEAIFGYPHCIVYEEDEEGYETIKTIRFIPYFGIHDKYYKEHEIKSFEPIAEEDIPPYE